MHACHQLCVCDFKIIWGKKPAHKKSLNELHNKDSMKKRVQFAQSPY